jgi:hypothetical protein
MSIRHAITSVSKKMLFLSPRKRKAVKVFQEILCAPTDQKAIDMALIWNFGGDGREVMAARRDALSLRLEKAKNSALFPSKGA